MAFPVHLKFSTNWNNKLNCGSFTTLRLYNEKKYAHGRVYNIYLKEEFLGTAQIVGIRRTLLSALNEFVARLDTGYSLPQCKSIITRMYGQGKDHELGLYLLKWVQVEKSSSIHVKNLHHTIDRLSAQLTDAERAMGKRLGDE